MDVTERLIKLILFEDIHEAPLDCLEKWIDVEDLLLAGDEEALTRAHIAATLLNLK